MRINVQQGDRQAGERLQHMSQRHNVKDEATSASWGNYTSYSMGENTNVYSSAVGGVNGNFELMGRKKYIVDPDEE